MLTPVPYTIIYLSLLYKNKHQHPYNMDTIEQEIERLRRDIEQYNHEYYVLNSPTVSDKEYDMLMKKLEQLELQHPEYDDPLSPHTA